MDISDVIMPIAFVVGIALTIAFLVKIFDLSFWVAAALGAPIGSGIIFGILFLVAKITKRKP